jgi:hypothetical protein
MYLVLPEDPNKIVERINKAIQVLGRDHVRVQRLTVSHTQKAVVRILPLWNLEGATISASIKGYEVFYNPELYSHMREKPNPSSLKIAAEEITNALFLLTGITWKSLSLPTKVAVVIFIIMSLGFLLIVALIVLKINKVQQLHRIEDICESVGLFKRLPNRLVESTHYIQLLESTAAISKIRSIMKLATTNPRKAIEVVTTLVKNELPKDSLARKNYLSLLKIAAASLNK